MGHDNASYSKIIIYGAFGGRIDHTLAAIHTLCKLNSTFEAKCRDNEIILMDEFSLMLYLEAGDHMIYPSQKYEGHLGVGLVPIGCEV